ncbi:MAG: hypothetical protein JOZ15_14690, partial [Acidobacteria bacterium]|nr:hypothetical protein [Acidobacteriota bacterium]
MSMPSPPSPPKQQFLAALDATAQMLCGPTAPNLKGGLAAVAEIFSQVEGLLSFSAVLDPIFAGHDLSHPVRLAQRVHQLVQANPPDAESPLRQMECLVLLFASLLLHDVGMALLTPELASKEWNEIWHGHLIRPQHDERSLLFIENTLLVQGETGKLPQ